MQKSVPSPGQDSSEAGAAPRSSLARTLVVLLVSLWLLSGLVPCSFSIAGERARRVKCTSNLKQITYACVLYSGDNAEAFPPDLGALVEEYISDGEIFQCPSSGRYRAGECPPGGPLEDKHLSYCYVSGLRATDDADFILAFDEEWNHDREGIVVAFVGGRVSWVRNVESLHARLKEQSAALAADGRTVNILRPSWSKWPEPPPDLPARFAWPWWFWLILAGAAVLVVLLAVAVVRRVVREYRTWAMRI